MDISNRFSLEDFLAYFFPGLTGALGVYVALLLTPLRGWLLGLSADIVMGILLLFVGYIVGVFLSGFAEPITKFYQRFKKARRWKDALLLPGYEKAIITAYKQVFGLPEEVELKWTDSCFYLCRSLVLDTMPNITPIIQRQSGLRQLRMNMLPSLLIWFLTGIAWGIWALNNHQSNLGVGVIVASAALFMLITVFTLDRMHSNEAREVREVLTAFLVGHETGKFTSQVRDRQ